MEYNQDKFLCTFKCSWRINIFVSLYLVFVVENPPCVQCVCVCVCCLCACMCVCVSMHKIHMSVSVHTVCLLVVFRCNSVEGTFCVFVEGWGWGSRGWGGGVTCVMSCTWMNLGLVPWAPVGSESCRAACSYWSCGGAKGKQQLGLVN